MNRPPPACAFGGNCKTKPSPNYRRQAKKVTRSGFRSRSRMTTVVRLIDSANKTITFNCSYIPIYTQTHTNAPDMEIAMRACWRNPVLPCVRSALEVSFCITAVALFSLMGFVRVANGLDDHADDDDGDEVPWNPLASAALLISLWQRVRRRAGDLACVILHRSGFGLRSRLTECRLVKVRLRLLPFGFRVLLVSTADSAVATQPRNRKEDGSRHKSKLSNMTQFGEGFTKERRYKWKLCSQKWFSGILVEFNVRMYLAVYKVVVDRRRPWINRIKFRKRSRKHTHTPHHTIKRRPLNTSYDSVTYSLPNMV